MRFTQEMLNALVSFKSQIVKTKRHLVNDSDVNSFIHSLHCFSRRLSQIEKKTNFTTSGLTGRLTCVDLRLLLSGFLQIVEAKAIVSICKLEIVHYVFVLTLKIYMHKLNYFWIFYTFIHYCTLLQSLRKCRNLRIYQLPLV